MEKKNEKEGGNSSKYRRRLIVLTQTNTRVNTKSDTELEMRVEFN